MNLALLEIQKPRGLFSAEGMRRTNKPSEQRPVAGCAGHPYLPPKAPFSSIENGGGSSQMPHSLAWKEPEVPSPSRTS